MPHEVKGVSLQVGVLRGKAVIEGTRIPVDLIVDLFAAGMKEEEILKEYPNLRRENLRAALEYASTVVRKEEIVPLPSRSRRTTVGVIADILRATREESSRTQIMYTANLSHTQAVKYIEMLVACGMLSKVVEKGSSKYTATTTGRIFVSQLSRFGRDFLVEAESKG